MNYLLKKLTCLVVLFLLLGCAVSQDINATPEIVEEPQDINVAPEVPQDVNVAPEVPQDINVAPEVPQDINVAPEVPQDINVAPEVPQDINVAPEVNNTPITQNWSEEWAYDEENHWHPCADEGCEEKKDLEPHEFGDLEYVNPAILVGEDKFKYAYPKAKICKTCGNYLPSSLEGINVIPEIRFTLENESEISFAKTASKNDVKRPEVAGTLTLTNCQDSYKLNNVPAKMKVRGNQTADWSKKAFSIKFDEKTNLLGLNGGKKFSKWVLLADAKDTTLIRSALGLFLSKAVSAEEENVWVSDFIPVAVYLNDQYWGYYYLAEQKEVVEGRINLPKVESEYADVDIGYCFELDYYAKDEAKKEDGSPTFTVDYKPKKITYNIEKSLANFGVTNTYTMLSEITNQETQLPFIKKKVENLYTVLYEAAVNNVAKTIVDDEVVDSDESVEKVINDNFDINTWVDGFIIYSFVCAPDVGYSSFYMSFDNTSTGEKKLRFDVPWDFDSNFGNRINFIVNPDQKNGTYDPYYMDRTSNMWLQLFGKLDFFIDAVKVKWNKIRDENVFEYMIYSMKSYFTKLDGEIRRNHYRWPENDAAVHNSFNEIREPFKDPRNYKDAEKETIRWCNSRVNYLESRWGNNRPNLE